MSNKGGQAEDTTVQSPEKVTFFRSWCKQCGNCVAFCPRQALAQDEWGNPYLKDPDRCTSCGLCNMLCPDFCISVGEGTSTASSGQAVPQPGSPGSLVRRRQSPERLATQPQEGEED